MQSTQRRIFIRSAQIAFKLQPPVSYQARLNRAAIGNIDRLFTQIAVARRAALSDPMALSG
ncbi:hypothetical protein E2553_02505 [Paraburkholderia dipogonis]|uniref:Uncharacterized protein n=1 Tax=Paraburkholderia dipogonis TaxID=1211383 RepID=A0A4Y8N3F7_9BURK|nr:hypothetical protein [Paraburkholderia dipogonis]TFE43998.1 hypothetical protein E2553_02505 [Paraburkholderia dipogonis]